MNLKGRPWRIAPDELEPLIRERRERGEAHKVIAHALGYSQDRIRKLCIRWKIRKRLKHKTDVDAQTQVASRSYLQALPRAEET